MSAGFGRLQSAVDLLVEVHVLLVVVEPQTREDAKAIGHEPFELAEGRGAHVAELQELVEAVAVEQARRRRRRARRQEEARRRRPLFLLEGRIGVERLAETRRCR